VIEHHMILARLEQLASSVDALKAFITQEFVRMSQTLESELQAATAAIQADVAEIATSLTTIATEISNLQAQLQPGATITQADIDAINALKTQADAVAATAQAMALPPPPAPPAAP
jgi:hypothetical protein